MMLYDSLDIHKPIFRAGTDPGRDVGGRIPSPTIFNNALDE